jgi:hypothetical protein
MSADDLERYAVAQERDRALLRASNAEVKALNERIAELQALTDTLTRVDGITAGGPKWTTPLKKQRRNVGIANLLLSDLHLDEVVRPEEIGGVNAYNRRIAEMRLRATFEKFIVVAKSHIGGVAYDGAVIAMIGDTFSGSIHDELAQTNEASTPESLDYWIDPVVAGLRLVADEFGKLHVPSATGNHDRLGKKPVHKGRARESWHTLFMRQVRRALKDDKRITFDIPEGPETQMRQYGTTFHYTHGDQFRGGSGISGIFTPLMLGDMRKRKRQQAIGQPYDVMCLGHFHQYLPTPWFIVNGSLKGYDEYASNNNFGFEPPRQAFWVTTPENGVTFSAPILPMDREKEGW